MVRENANKSQTEKDQCEILVMEINGVSTISDLENYENLNARIQELIKT